MGKKEETGEEERVERHVKEEEKGSGWQREKRGGNGKDCVRKFYYNKLAIVSNKRFMFCSFTVECLS